MNVDDSSVLQDDLRDMCRALGVFDGARPQSPHDVFRECIAVAERLKLERAHLITAAVEIVDGFGPNHHSLFCKRTAEAVLARVSQQQPPAPK